MIAIKKEMILENPLKLELVFSDLPFQKGQKLEILIIAEDKISSTPSSIDLNSFGFLKSREILKGLKTSLSEEIIKERREAL